MPNLRPYGGGKALTFIYKPHESYFSPRSVVAKLHPWHLMEFRTV